MRACGPDGGRLRSVSDQSPAQTDPTQQPDQQADQQADEPVRSGGDLESLVGQWLTVPDIAERLGVPLSRVRQLLADRELLGVRIGERRVMAVPEKFLDETGPRPELRGTFTVLADGGYDDEEIITWLFTPDATLPVEGAPIDAMRAGHKTEIRRRAQELAL
ncbi:hypothetical protein GCM10023258_24960 [Terrabacter aeriphilus]|uniref:Rv2175c C-terminal domain-containing protein n=1 Tax=Terrabacter aeriphilus TaxID=515662 RepID=A0ABP9JGV3_9MICO